MAEDGAQADRAKLYVILGSHACRTAMLELEHKGIDYDVVRLPTGLHGPALRLMGFAGNPRSFREIDGAPHHMLAFADRTGTVPSLRLGGEGVKTNRNIARFLETIRPEPPLFPADPARREQVEQIERWGDEVLQMDARRLGMAAGLAGHLRADGGEGRLGPLLFEHDTIRRLSVHLFGRVFAASAAEEATLLDRARADLDEVDHWVEEGILDAPALTAADFMIAPSVALLDYHPQLSAEIAARPSGRLLDRVLPGVTAPV